MGLWGRFTVDVPGLSPDLLGDVEIWQTLSDHVSEHASEDDRESSDGKEERLASIQPMGLV